MSETIESLIQRLKGEFERPRLLEPHNLTADQIMAIHQALDTIRELEKYNLPNFKKAFADG